MHNHIAYGGFVIGNRSVINALGKVYVSKRFSVNNTGGGIDDPAPIIAVAQCRASARCEIECTAHGQVIGVPQVHCTFFAIICFEITTPKAAKVFNADNLTASSTEYQVTAAIAQFLDFQFRKNGFHACRKHIELRMALAVIIHPHAETASVKVTACEIAALNAVAYDTLQERDKASGGIAMFVEECIFVAQQFALYGIYFGIEAFVVIVLQLVYIQAQTTYIFGHLTYLVQDDFHVIRKCNIVLRQDAIAIFYRYLLNV